MDRTFGHRGETIVIQSEKVALRSSLPPLDVVDSGNLVVSSQVTDECRGA